MLCVVISSPQFSVHLPGCDVATLNVSLQLIYTGEVRLHDHAQLSRVVDVCASLGVDVNRLHNVHITVDRHLPSTSDTDHILTVYELLSLLALQFYDKM